MMTKELFINACLSFLNTPYRWGGDDPTGIDCSGLTQEILAMLGLDPEGDQSADALYRHFLVRGKQGVKDAGALVFFGRPDKITHVGVLLDSVTMIEAGGGGSRTLNLADAVAQNAFVRLRPYWRRKDVVAIIRPNDLPF